MDQMKLVDTGSNAGTNAGLGGAIGAVVGSWLDPNGRRRGGYDDEAGIARSNANAIDKLDTNLNNLGLTVVKGQGDANLTVANANAGVAQAVQSGTAQMLNATAQSAAGLNTAIKDNTYDVVTAIKDSQLSSQECCCKLLQAIERQGCENRELQRQIQYENTQTALCDAKAEIAALKASAATALQLQEQTRTLLARLPAC